MSLLGALQDWLAEYSAMSIQPLTDRPEAVPSSYAVAPAGNGKISADILGNRTYQNSYVFYAKEAAAAETDRQDTHDFLEALSAWIEERSEDCDFPVLPAGYEVEEIAVSNGMLMDLYDDGAGLYQIQINMIFTKRRE